MNKVTKIGIAFFIIGIVVLPILSVVASLLSGNSSIITLTNIKENGDFDMVCNNWFALRLFGAGIIVFLVGSVIIMCTITWDDNYYPSILKRRKNGEI